jgi:hypothetical protein
MTDVQTAQAMDRAAMLLKLASQYIRDLPFDVVTDADLMHYDGADCDGICLADDCDAAAHDLELTPALQQ